MNEFRVPKLMWGIAIWQVAMTLVASVADWPAQFDTDGSSPQGIAQWFQKGTALSAPILFIFAIVVVGVLATRKNFVGVAGVALALVIALLTTVAGLGETFAANPVTSPRGVLIVSGVMGVFFAAMIIWAAMHDLRVRRTLRNSLS